MDTTEEKTLREVLLYAAERLETEAPNPYATTNKQAQRNQIAMRLVRDLRAFVATEEGT